MSRREEQIDELECFLSMLECFDGSLEYAKPESGEIHGKIRIDLPLLDRPVNVFVGIEEMPNSREVRALEHCTLLFSLPDEYPSIPPDIEIECSWMSKEKCAEIRKIIDETAATYEDQPMLYAIALAVRENAYLNLDLPLNVNNTPYCIAKNINGITILRRLVEASNVIEQAAFERECHDCEVCWENELGSRCVRFLPCRHVFCSTCVKQHFLSQLKTEGIKTFECLEVGCFSIAAQAVVRKSIGDEEYDRYETILLDRAVNNMSDLTVCPREGCESYAFVRADNSQLATCQACAFPFCTTCRKTYHGVDKCSDQSDDALKLLEEFDKDDSSVEATFAQAVLRKTINKLQNEKWVRENSKKCPSCKTDIEKTEGCNKMRCRQCDVGFCWICLEILGGDDPYRHFTPGSGNACANRLMDRVEVETEGDEEAAEADEFLALVEAVDNLDDLEEIIAAEGVNLYENYADYAYVKPEKPEDQPKEEEETEEAEVQDEGRRKREGRWARAERRRRGG